MENSNNPLISIITVTYNADSVLENTILSVINQTYDNIEYIIIDGGSTDGTIDIIKKYENKISYWISEPDKGIYDAMNKGIIKATGEWINFMNAGDYFYEKDVLPKLFVENESKINKCDAFYGDTVYEYDTYSYLEVAPQVNTLLQDKYFSHQSSFVRTELMKEYQFDINMKICSDYLLFYQLYIHQKKIIYIPLTISSFCGEDGTSDKYKIITYKERATINNSQNKNGWYIKYILFCLRIKLGVFIRKFFSRDKILKIRKRRIFDNERIKWVKIN